MRRLLYGVAAAVLLSSSWWACSSSTTSPSTPTTPTRIIGLNGNLGFGAVDVGSSRTNTLTISNSGNAVLTISGMTVSGGLSTVLTASWTDGTIAAGASQTVNLRFAPTAAQTYTGTLTVNGDQTSGTNSATISGAGVGGTPPAPPPPTTFILSGIVRNASTNAGIASATVLVTDGPNANRSGSTSATGAYSIANLIQSGFTVRFSATGFDDALRPVTLTANTQLDVALQPRTGGGGGGGGPVGEPGKPPKTGSTCSLNDIVHPAACVNSMFGNATAICDDGARSCSTNRSGTCSSHGGVYCWVCPGPLC